ncbi:interferon-induced very large GTPase 1 isoform X1 [Alligator mississippiensis]|nr:interferon-induced very large GTPase 1 isoform X1 [Alligator mississippiensis]XP_059587383.1 interferon-induced very large GTPase 1 isoform X1 [Alligator mississippiensis]
MEKTLEDHLLEAVEGLGKEDWKKFKYKLKHYKLKPGYNHIPWMILEEAERLEVVEEMTDHFGTRYGVEIAVDVLNAINKRKHADDLSQALREDDVNQSAVSATAQAPRQEGGDGLEQGQASDSQRGTEQEEEAGINPEEKTEIQEDPALEKTDTSPGGDPENPESLTAAGATEEEIQDEQGSGSELRRCDDRMDLQPLEKEERFNTLRQLCGSQQKRLRSLRDSTGTKQEVLGRKSQCPWKETFRKERRQAPCEVLSRLHLIRYVDDKLKLSHVLEIITRHQTPRSLADFPWHFLRKVLGLDGTARNMGLGQKAKGGDDKGEMDTGETLHPLDLICAVLSCSDPFLQQEILARMAMCQFALPLLLPSLKASQCTLLLWAMRGIATTWMPHTKAKSRGPREESLVLTLMPTFSFVRLGRCSVSKSRLLNEILSPLQQPHNFFVHRDMEAGNVPRKLANGLVEISWYFPSGKKSSDLFPEPLAVTNLRGDIKSHWQEFTFLTQVSSAVFILTDGVQQSDYELLSSLQASTTTYYFILTHQDGATNEMVDSLKNLTPALKLTQSQVLVRGQDTHHAHFVEKLRRSLRDTMTGAERKGRLSDMADVARGLEMKVDEDHEACQKGKTRAGDITREIKDVAKYKRDMLRLQGDLWKELARVEKERCQMRSQGDAAPEQYQSQLTARWLHLRGQQHTCGVPPGVTKFIAALRQLAPVEKRYFLKWLALQLDHVMWGDLSRQRPQDKEKPNRLDPRRLQEADELVSAASLGVEHFMRELGQLYEAECSMLKEGNIQEHQRKFRPLPGIAAELMLEGFPVELIDGDAANIPVQWVTDLLTQLHARVEGRSRLLVVTVVGAQSTGKSTLLNAMFGLQFATGSGRGTPGAFMSLRKVAGTSQEQLGCDFLLVIDTKGLKGPQWAIPHDNELATVVIGLSDIVMVNMVMENTTETKDVLQVVAHAALRTGEIGVKPFCQLVQHDFSDGSSRPPNMALLEQLKDVAQATARTEKGKATKLSDVMRYDAENHTWCLPGLWHGAPPVAPVNPAYSKSVEELRASLFEALQKTRPENRAAKDIPQFVEWMRSLWRAAKHENITLSFRNRLLAEAYNQLSMDYTELEWGFRKAMLFWASETETSIQNQPTGTLDKRASIQLQHEVQERVRQEVGKLVEGIELCFEREAASLQLMEKHREDFLRSAEGLGKELENDCFAKCQEAVEVAKGRHRLEVALGECHRQLGKKVSGLLEQCRASEDQLDSDVLDAEFERAWRETLSELPLSPLEKYNLEKRQIREEMETQLRKDLEHLEGTARELLGEARLLSDRPALPFQMRKEYLDLSAVRGIIERFTQACWERTEALAQSLIEDCKRYTAEKAASKAGYHEVYCRELLRMVNEPLRKCPSQQRRTSALFEVELKRHILGEAAAKFQKMHEDFIRENDTLQRLERLKPQYLSMFKARYWGRHECRDWAWDFCQWCLKPALEDYVSKRLGVEIVDDLVTKGGSSTFKSRIHFQYAVLKELLEREDFNGYVQYIQSHVEFVKSRIQRQLVTHYTEKASLGGLEEKVLSTITKKVCKVLACSEAEKTQPVATFLSRFCEELRQDLVIPRDSLEVILFQTTATAGEFSARLLHLVPLLQREVLAGWKNVEVQSRLSGLPVKPQDEMFKRVFGCGEQCPFCKVPCEAGGREHGEHFASVHRPQGLDSYRCEETNVLVFDVCSSSVVSNNWFQNADTAGQLHPYKEYQQYYPAWRIQPDPSIHASDYWKFVFKEFNEQFARVYKCLPARLPEDWCRLTKEQALQSLSKSTYMSSRVRLSQQDFPGT